MPIRGTLARGLLGLSAASAAVVAVVGGLALPPSGLVAVALLGAVCGGVAFGAVAGGLTGTSEGPLSAPVRRAAASAAGSVAAGTVGVLLLLSGAGVLAGGPGAVLAAAILTAAAAGIGYSRVRARRPATVPGRPAAGRSVRELSTGEVCRAWTATTAALGGRLDPTARRIVVARRQELLDELERRDPVGFGRWLAGDPLLGSDPAVHLRDGDPAT